MTHRERVEATLAGKAVDRPAVSMWRHFYDLEQTIDGLVEAMLAFQKRFDWDFIKVNPRACYHVQDWHNRYDFSPAPQAGPNLVDHRIKTPDDWLKLPVLASTEGVLGEHVVALGEIRTQLDPDVPMIMTVFTPLSLAEELAGKKGLAEHFAQPEKLKAGLERITETFEHFVDMCFAAGVDGIFYATTFWASRDSLTEQQYDEFSRPYDERIMNRIRKKGWLNVLHVCKSNNMLLHLADLKPNAFHWDATDKTNLSIGEGLKRLNAPVIGSIDGQRLADEGAGPWVDEQLKACAKATGKRRWIVGAGCTVPANISDDSLTYVRQAVERL
jgi:uroporphyrinogen decarboxylase